MKKTPLIFIGHGSPMNAIEDNIYTESWKKIGSSLKVTPRAILMLSAHWITTWVTRIATSKNPSMIYDMGGFPSELYQIKYNAPGSSSIVQEINDFLGEDFPLQLDPMRGFDHGSWSVLMHLFPLADIPVISMSLDYSLSPESLFHLGQKLAHLREQGILIVASGNIVHNLRAIDWSGENIYPWAVEFDQRVASGISTGKNSKEFMDILDFQSWGDISKLAHPTHDHLLPLFPLLGAVSEDDSVSFYTPEITMGSLAMRSIVWGE